MQVVSDVGLSSDFRNLCCWGLRATSWNTLVSFITHLDEELQGSTGKSVILRVRITLAFGCACVRAEEIIEWICGDKRVASCQQAFSCGVRK